MIQKKVLAETIRSLAAQKGISVSMLETEAGYSQGMISRWAASEDGDFNVLTKLVAIADKLDVPFDALLGRGRGVEDPSGTTRSHTGSRIAFLTEETERDGLQWKKLPCDGGKILSEERIAALENDKAVTEIWYAKVKDLYVLVVCYCDDIDDNSEPLALSLYCYVGHNMPLYPIPVGGGDDTALRSLYSCLKLQAAVGAFRGNDVSETFERTSRDEVSSKGLRMLRAE